MNAVSDMPAVVLLSGGLDSATAAAIARARDSRSTRSRSRTVSVTVWELEAARRVASAWESRNIASSHIDLRAFGGSALTAEIAVPKGRTRDEMAHGIPITYVPARNTIFLRSRWRGPSAGSERHFHRRECAGLQRLSGLPAGVHRGLRADGQSRDARPASKAGNAHDPHAAHRSDEGRDHPARDRSGRRLLAHDELLRSRAQTAKPAGIVTACLLRLKGFREAGLADPIAYAAEPGCAR